MAKRKPKDPKPHSFLNKLLINQWLLSLFGIDPLADNKERPHTGRATAKRDLEDLVRKGVLVLMGAGRGAFYNMPKKRLINGSNESSGSKKENGS